jgi:ribose transport system substrate-binding protein
LRVPISRSLALPSKRQPAIEVLPTRRYKLVRRAGIVLTGLLLSFNLACKSHRIPLIAIIPATTAEELTESEHAGAERAARALNWDVYWNGPSREDDFPRQIRLVYQVIDSNVAGLVLSPDHAVALISPVRSALAKGIPTVIVGTPLGTSPGGNLLFVVNDDAATGRLAAERAWQYLQPNDAVAILGIDPNMLGSIERADAFEASLRTRFPKVRMIERRSLSFSGAEAEASVENVIHSVPELRVIISLNINQTRAAVDALHRSGASRKVVLIGCDQDLDLMLHLRLGDIDSVVAENTREMGYQAMQIIHSRLLGESTDSKFVVKPILVTKENIDSADVQEVLDMDWREK